MTAPNVKARLTSNRRRDVADNDEYAAFSRRVLRAYARRVGTGDVEALAAMVALSAELDDALHHAVVGLRRFGYSWAEIAARLGITRQAAHQRWAAQPSTTTACDHPAHHDLEESTP